MNYADLKARDLQDLHKQYRDFQDLEAQAILDFGEASKETQLWTECKQIVRDLIYKLQA